MALLTVGIPTYNSAKHVLETINSLKTQSFSDWKCLISDDASSDETVKIVNAAIENNPRFEFIQQAKRLGPADNWNFLLESVESPYFKLLHADDLLHPHHLEILIKSMQDNPKCSLISSNRSFARNPKPFKSAPQKFKTRYFSRSQFINNYLFVGFNFVGEPSFTIYKTEPLKEVGGFSKSWNYLIDMDSYVKVLEKGDYIKILENLGTFRISPHSWSSTLADKQLKEEKEFLNHISNNSKKVYFGLFFINIRSFLRRLYFKIAR